MDVDEEKKEFKKPLLVDPGVAEDFVFDGQSAKDEKLYVLQLPRIFPKFVDPHDADVKDVKPDVEVKDEDEEMNEGGYQYSGDPLQPAYTPGEWQGWAKGGGRRRNEDLGGGTEGRIGSLLIHRSGKVRMRLGDLVYDVSLSSLPLPHIPDAPVCL
jgi:hypothetical protein